MNADADPATGPDAEVARECVAARLVDADLPVKRFINVRDGGKGTRDHSTISPDAVTGNYGVYAGDGLALIDVDDGDAKGMAALDLLPQTFTVRSPHARDEREGHLYLAVTDYEAHGDTLGEACNAALGKRNPKPAWGEVRVHNQYVVGPGSQLDSCNKDGCEQCSDPDGGYYRIAADRPIATVTFEQFVAVLQTGLDDPGSERESTRPRANRRKRTPPGDAAISVYDVLSRRDYPEDKRVEHPFHGSKSGRNFMVDDGGETWRCWRHGCTGNADHLVGIEQGVISCGDWDGGGLSSGTWREIYDAARAARYDVPDPDADDHKLGDADDGDDQGDYRGDQPDEWLSPAGVAALAGLGEDETLADLNDRQKAAVVYEAVRQSETVHVRVERDSGAIWATTPTDDGLWSAEGERALAHAARRALGAANYGQNVLAELQTQVHADPAVEVTVDDFGVAPGYVAVENGLLDLDAAADGAGMDALRPLQPDDLAMVRLPAPFDPDADADEWRALVAEWAEDDRAAALQEHVGYCLHVGALPIHRALLLVGEGANGKGTFLAVVRALLGDENTTSIELQTLANEKDAVADFHGSLANIDDDLSARKLGAGLGMFKKLVAGDPVRARRLYEDGFEFTPTGKHLYAANEVPDVKVPDDDEAFWRRWLLVEFPNHYPPSERDTDLRDSLTTPEALSGVLNWAIEGRARLLDHGHYTGEHQWAHQKRERWQAWGDSVDQFISECVERDEDAGRITTGDAHRRYAAWCRQQDGVRPVGQQQFTNTLKMENVGYGRHRIDGDVQRGYEALGFSDDVPDHAATPERDPGPGTGESLRDY